MDATTITGVRFHKRTWEARRYGVWLGCYPTLFEAACAVKSIEAIKGRSVTASELLAGARAKVHVLREENARLRAEIRILKAQARAQA